MLYQTVEFAVFYLVVFALYWIAARHLRIQNLLLLLAGYVFYACWDWRFLGLLWALASLDFWIVRNIAASEGKPRRNWLWAGAGLLLGVLGVFKYYGFFADSLIGLFRALGYGLSERTTYILLPVGISFYIFQ
ncbi:MAG: MBOAT family protein, partial [Bacteroidetes bacterium]